jgi:hypothetical protein
VALQQPDGTTTYPLWNTIRPANFGDGASEDLYARFGGQNSALLHDPSDAGVLTIGPSAPNRPGTCFILNADVNGDGIADFVNTCSGTPPPPDAGAFVEVSTSSGGGATLGFSAWQKLYTSSDATNAQSICTFGNGSVLFTGREMVQVNWNGSSTVATASPLGAWSAAATILRVTCARINADAYIDVALTDSNNKLHLYLGSDAGTFTEIPAPALPATSVLTTENSDGGPVDLLLLPPGATSDYTVMLNDGDGGFP